MLPGQVSTPVFNPVAVLVFTALARLHRLLGWQGTHYGCPEGGDTAAFNVGQIVMDFFLRHARSQSGNSNASLANGDY